MNMTSGLPAIATSRPSGLTSAWCNGHPILCRAAQVPLQLARLGILAEPLAQPRPFAQHRFVRDLDLAVADRDQPLAGEHLDHLAGVGAEVCDRDPPTHDGVAFALAGEAQQHAPRDPALLAGETLVARSASRATAPSTPPAWS